MIFILQNLDGGRGHLKSITTSSQYLLDLILSNLQIIRFCCLANLILFS